MEIGSVRVSGGSSALRTRAIRRFDKCVVSFRRYWRALYADQYYPDGPLSRDNGTCLIHRNPLCDSHRSGITLSIVGHPAIRTTFRIARYPTSNRKQNKFTDNNSALPNRLTDFTAAFDSIMEVQMNSRWWLVLVVTVAFAIFPSRFLMGKDSETPHDQLIEPLRGFLQRYLGGTRFGPDKTTRVSAGSVPIKTGQDEVIVYVVGRSWCGSGGCTLLVLESRGSSYQVIGRTSIVQLPVRLLPTLSHGHPDIGVRVQGGGIQKGYEAILSFDGKAYPTNPSAPPARRPTGKVEGTTLVSSVADSVPLYE